MYPLDTQRLSGLREGVARGRWGGLAPNVFLLGLTSLLTDISSEMVTAVLPVYLLFALGLTPLQFGVIDGVSQGAAAIVRLIGGLCADRWQRNREVAAAGYGLSAACKLLLPAVGNAWGLLAGVIAVDRLGKGIRTAPRDALISLSCTPARLGFAFGVHRAFDTAGALLGPLLGFAILAALPGSYGLIFVASFGFAIVGLAVLLCFVRNVPQRASTAAPPGAWWTDAVALLREPRLRRLAFAGAALGLATVADAFVFLALQRRMATQPATLPLFFVAVALSYLLLAVPAGRLGDRVGRGRVFAFGHVLLLLACSTLLMPGDAPWIALAALLALGGYYACTDGVLMAAAGAIVPAASRATGLAIVASATGLARLVASMLFGALWHWRSLELAFAVFCAGLALALAFTARTWWRLETGR
jgi:MFS family permease